MEHMLKKKTSIKLLFFVIAFILFLPLSFANGGCIKVEDDVLVQMSAVPLVPATNEQTSFLFSFANIKKELINEEINGTLKIVKKEEIILTKDFKIKDGILDLKHTFKNPGLYEIFFDFSIGNRTYMPEDFLIEVKEEKQNFIFYGLFFALGAIVGLVINKLFTKK